MSNESKLHIQMQTNTNKKQQKKKQIGRKELDEYEREERMIAR